MNERQLNAKLRKDLSSIEEVFVINFNDFSPGLKPFDFLFVYQGRIFGVEAKIENRRLRPNQEYYLNRLKTVGGIPLILRYFPSDSTFCLKQFPSEELILIDKLPVNAKDFLQGLLLVLTFRDA